MGPGRAADGTGSARLQVPVQPKPPESATQPAQAASASASASLPVSASASASGNHVTAATASGIEFPRENLAFVKHATGGGPVPGGPPGPVTVHDDARQAESGGVPNDSRTMFT